MHQWLVVSGRRKEEPDLTPATARDESDHHSKDEG